MEKPGLYIPTTKVDIVAGTAVGEERLEIGFRNAYQSVRDFAGENVIPEPDLTLIARAVSHRRELNRTEFTSPKMGRAINRILRKINSADAFRTPNTPLSDDQKRLQLSELLAITKAQKKLGLVRPISLPIDQDLTIQIEFAPSQWEGLYGVFFSAQKKGSSSTFPLYAVRVNPRLVGDEVSVAVRSIQGWVSEELAGRGIKYRYHGMDKYSPETLSVIDSIVRERNRVLDTIVRRFSAGRNINGQRVDIKPAELFLLLSLVYFQKLGVKLFEGLEHRFHPSVLSGHEKELSFNLDDLFRKYFYPTDNAMYKWQLDTGNGYYIPNWGNFGAAFKKLILDLFLRA